MAPLIKRWIDEYRVAHRNVTISYDAVGSGEGVNRFLAEEVDFAGSDEILTDSEIGKARNGAIMVPVTAGMIVLAYNIPGVENEIKLLRDVLIDIFAGKIRKWDDPRILAAIITPTAHAGQLALSERVARVKDLDASVADPADKGAYPITTYSWVLLSSRYVDRTKGKAVRDFVEWGLSQQAQNYGEQLGYIPLSATRQPICKEKQR